MNALLARSLVLGRMLALWVFTPILCLQSSHAQSLKGEYRPDRLIILPKRGLDSPGLQKLHSQGGRRVLSAFSNLGGLQVVQLAPGEKLAEAALHYRTSGLVEFVEPDYKLHATALPNDPEFVGGTQWALRNTSSPGRDISAAAGWDTLTSASNVVVAIIDSGIRYTHNDLAANVWTNSKEIPDNGIDDDRNGIIDDVHGINALTSTGDVMDDAGHGTHVAGIIGAVGNNGIGITGVAWNVQLMACKFLDGNGDGDTSDAIRSVSYARRNGAHIINASWGGGDYSAALNTAIAEARAAGIIFVTAAGNESENIDNVPIYPACYTLDNIVVVGGTGRSDVVDTSYSNYGAVNVDLCAPGSGIYSTWNSWDGAYTYLSGTSMSSPHVAGALALMKARFPTLSSIDLINRLYSTVDVLPALSGKCRTGGRLNLARALGSDPTANFTASKLSGEPPLVVSFTNLTIGELRSVSWDFGDGSEHSTDPNPTHVFAEDGNFTVRLTVVGTNDRTNNVERRVSVISNYEVGPETYNWVESGEMTPVSLTDNGVSFAQALPFAFEFYGMSYSSLYIGANGLLGFNSASLGTTSNTTLPVGSAPNAIICPYWDNLNPAAGGTVYFGLTGEAPTRRCVVSWVGIPRNSTAVQMTFQAILEEGSNEIVFQYLEVSPNTTRGGARGATVGIENETGTVGALYTYNGAPTVLENESALRFKPNRYNFLVSDRSRLAFNGASGHAVSRLPASLTLSNPGTEDLTWSIASSDAWLQLSVSGGTLAAGTRTNIDVTLAGEVDSFGVGQYPATLTLRNETGGGGNTVLPALLTLEEAKTVLTLRNAGDKLFTGGLGGPFTPAVYHLELANDGNIPLDWKESTMADWLAVSPDAGTLAAGETQIVEVSISAAAEEFRSGVTNGIISFENLTSPTPTIDQAFQLEIRSRLEQTAARIVDGVFSGTLAVPEGTVYRVEFSDDLQIWTPLEAVSVVKNGALIFEDSTIAGTQRFYRVRVE